MNLSTKKEEEGHKLISYEPQAENYAKSKLKYLDNAPLPFVYESTGILTRFTDFRDPKPRSRPVFTFHRPETFKAWMKEGKSLRTRMLDIPGLPEIGLRKQAEQEFMKYQAGSLKFNEEQMNWLRMMKEHIASSFHIEVDDMDRTPFDAHGGRGMMFKIFGYEMNAVISEMNEAMAG